jgi:hypothetical protein
MDEAILREKAAMASRYGLVKADYRKDLLPSLE